MWLRIYLFCVFQLFWFEFCRRSSRILVGKAAGFGQLGNSLNSTSLCNSMCSSVLSYSIASIFVFTGCGFSGPLCRSLAGSRYGFFHSGHQIQFTQWGRRCKYYLFNWSFLLVIFWSNLYDFIAYYSHTYIFIEVFVSLELVWNIKSALQAKHFCQIFEQ